MIGRIGWDEYFLEIAKLVSTRATCPRASVGTVLVKDKRIISSGYNGAPSGEPHCSAEGVGCLIVDNHCQRAIHSEVNAIAQAAKYGIPIEGATLYLYSSRGEKVPCRECMKVVVAAGVTVFGAE